MLRYLALMLLVPINTILAVEHHEFLKELDFEQFQLNMHKDECYLVYQGISGFLISKEEVSPFTIDLSVVEQSIAAIKMEVILFEKNPFSHDPAVFLKHAKGLHSQLLQPVNELLKSRISILPSMELDMIPWNALLDESDNFLIEQHEISLKKTIETSVGKQFTRSQLQLMVLAPIFNGNLSLRSDLEVDKINKLIENHKAAWESCDILHVSSHGRIDTSDWLASGILIGDNSILRNEDISSKCMEAELVFLNICEGAKKWNHSNSIVDAFEDAGAKSTIGALWQVNDEFAIELSSNFYRELMKGKRSGEALRNSILSYKKNCELTSELHPLTWSGFQLYGMNTKVIAYNSFGIKRVLSLVLSIFTSFSLISYYFGHQILERVKMYEFS